MAADQIKEQWAAAVFQRDGSQATHEANAGALAALEQIERLRDLTFEQLINTLLDEEEQANGPEIRANE